MIDGDFFESLADISFGDVYKNFKHLSINPIIEKNNKNPLIVYINTDRLLQLLYLVKNINSEFIIITHNSDCTFTQIPNIPDNVIRIFCQNYNGSQTKVEALPIGLERRMWFPEERKQEVLKKYIGIDIIKDIEVYMNFNPNTNKERYEWYHYLNGKDFVNTEMLGNGNNYENYIQKLKRSKFVVSPPGNGIDCHRNYECLYLGVIPIIQKSDFTINMFSDMNVMLIDKITDLTRESLNNYIEKPNKEKITEKYWKNKIMCYVK